MVMHHGHHPGSFSISDGRDGICESRCDNNSRARMKGLDTQRVTQAPPAGYDISTNVHG
jgi:hypothetical protein